MPGYVPCSAAIARLQRDFESGRVDPGGFLDVKHRLETLLCALPDGEIRLAAAHDGVMSITGSGRCFEIPLHRYAHVHAAQAIRELAIRVHLQGSIKHIALQLRRKTLRAGDLLELCS